jgi:RluA family pseudouridine synthase
MTSQRKRPQTNPNAPRRRSSHSNIIRLGRSVSVPVLYEDREIMAIDKPAGWMVTTPKWSRTKQNLQREIEIAIDRRETWVTQKQIRFLRFVHRLDRETSGVLLLAKNRSAIVKLSQLFSDQQIKKFYVCIVHGRPPLEAWKCTAPIGPCNDLDHRMKVDPLEGQESVTYFKRLHSSGKLSLILAAPQTGRTHQIRVHLSSSGFGIIGDALYSSRPKTSSPKSSPPREEKKKVQPDLGLRAWGVRFRHPTTGKTIIIEAELSRFLSRYFQKYSVPELFQSYKDLREFEQTPNLYKTATGAFEIEGHISG